MKSTFACSLPPHGMSVATDQVHVWHASLDRSPAEAIQLEKNLSSDELARAARFRNSIDRQRFVTCRGMLREILSQYVDARPVDLEFGYGKYGKPRLKSSSGTDLLCFNVSHSAGLAIFAVAWGREVGVDIEHFQADFAWEEIATSFFSSQELCVLRSLPIQHQYQAFLDAWTCKEACAKARGDGLSLPLQQLQVSQSPDESYSFQPSDNTMKPSRWTLKTFTPVAGFTGALAVEGSDWQMTCGEWQG